MEEADFALVDLVLPPSLAVPPAALLDCADSEEHWLTLWSALSQILTARTDLLLLEHDSHRNYFRRSLVQPADRPILLQLLRSCSLLTLSRTESSRVPFALTSSSEPSRDGPRAVSQGKQTTPTQSGDKR